MDQTMDQKHNKRSHLHPLYSKLAKSLFLGAFIAGYCAYPASLVIAADSANSLQDELDAINNKIKSYNSLVNQTQQQRVMLANEIKILEANAAALEKKISDNTQQIQSLDSEITGIRSKIDEKERIIIAQKDLLKQLMRSYYENTERTKIQLLLSTQESNQLLDQNDWTVETGDKIKELLADMQSTKAGLATQHDSLQDKKQQADALRAQLERRSGYLETTKQSKESLVVKTQVQEKKYNNIIDDLEEKRNEIEDEINQLEAAKTSNLDLSKLPAFRKSTLYFPVANPHKSQGYGKATWTKQYSFHNGIDFSDSTGTPIIAAGDGKVLATGNNGKYAYGKWIAIDHGNGLVTMYGHLSVQKVSKGESVKRGGVIGLMGNTGFSTGPHVHFSVFAKNSFDIVPSTKVSGLMLPTGAHVNPANYLP
ncbi:MAG: peptidoglycan DD-metalloendopeptidase family protein [Candidatus Moranbacteria bacterium]|nr:peptidoglycan DD-metalloendopeptidase family protein [Candidatus Moranbacteria bacterium]